MARKRPTTWLSETRTETPGRKYLHCLFVEDSCHRDAGTDFAEYFQRAHDDAIQRMRRLTAVSLHPAAAPPSPASNGYPYALPDVTLQGYFGEVMAAWLAETAQPSGHPDWTVPAHLFRFHLLAFQFLEQLSQAGTAPGAIVGRTGDDCVAFRRTADNRITAVLFCEAKCTGTHNATLIKDAHEKLSDSPIVDIPQLVEILLDQGTAEAVAWADSLRAFHLQLHDRHSIKPERHDLVCYVYSQPPVRSTTWIPQDAPHKSYTARRTLNAFEVRLSDVSCCLRSVYAKELWP